MAGSSATVCWAALTRWEGTEGMLALIFVLCLRAFGLPLPAASPAPSTLISLQTEMATRSTATLRPPPPSAGNPIRLRLLDQLCPLLAARSGMRCKRVHGDYLLVGWRTGWMDAASSSLAAWSQRAMMASSRWASVLRSSSVCAPGGKATPRASASRKRTTGRTRA